MKTNKLVYALSGFLVLSTLLFGNAVSADNNNSKRDDDKQEKKEMKNNVDMPTLSVSLSQNGKVNVSGAKVTAVSGNTVNAATTWGSMSLNWQLNVGSDTKINKRFDGRGSLSEIVVGHTISFQGNLATNSSASPIIVNATHIKDWSVQKPTPVKRSIEGTIESVGGVSLPSTMVVKDGDKNFTVSISADTLIVNSVWVRTPFSSLKVGDKVKVYGDVNVDASTVNAIFIRDASLGI